MNKANLPSIFELKSFSWILGSILLLVFGIIIPYGKSKDLNFTFLSLGMLLLLWGFLHPRSLVYPYKFWMALGKILGFINTRILLSFIFFFIFSPIALIKRIFGRDSMDRKWEKNQISYRVVVSSRPVDHMERPF